MNIKKTLATAVASVSVFSTVSMAESNEEYIKTFGMITFERNGFTELKLNEAEFNALVAGMKEINDGGKLPANIQQIGPKMMQYLTARAEANAAVESEKAKAIATAFWKDLEKNEKIKKTPSGLGYEIIEMGSSNVPGENSNVVVSYEGKLIDGTVFDSSKNHGAPAQFNLSKVIPGFREGLQKIGKGGKARLYIPAELGYGEQLVPGIPANSTLIFDVEIIDIDPAGSASPAPTPKEAGQDAGSKPANEMPSIKK